MINEIVTRAAEELTIALNNFNITGKDIIIENLAQNELADMQKVLSDENRKDISERFELEKATLREQIENAKKVIKNTETTTIDNLNNIVESTKSDVNTTVARAKTEVDDTLKNATADINDFVTNKENEIDEAINKCKTNINDTVNKGNEIINNTADSATDEIKSLVETTTKEVEIGVETIATKKNEAVSTINNKTDDEIARLKELIVESEKALLGRLETEKIKALDEVRAFIQNFLQNSYYIQFPNMPTPDTFFSLEGYRWSEVNYGGAFFRASGGNANGFNSGVQGGGIPDVHGWLGFHGDRGGFAGVKGKEGKSGNRGVFQERKRIENPYYGIATQLNANIGEKWKHLYLIESTKFALSYGGMPIANEVRPVNYTVRLWKLEKI